jgi:hypothetical protein
MIGYIHIIISLIHLSVLRNVPQGSTIKGHYKSYSAWRQKLNETCSFATFLMDVFDAWDVAFPPREEHDMQEDSLGEALRVPPSNKFIKNKRNYFVKGGSMFEIRLKMRMKNHQHSLVTEGTKHARCIICCEHCIKGTHPDHHTRVGMQTKCACSYCSLALHQQLNQGKSDVGEFNIKNDKIPLCNIARYTHMEGDEYNEFRNKTCWQILHECENFPPHKCLMNNSIAEESQNDVTPMRARSKSMEKRRRTS